MAFVWNGENQDNADIYVQMIGAGNPLRLTSSAEPDLYPAWSPDGRAIAFQRQAADGNHGVYLVPPLGGPQRKIATAKGYGLAWSPDSRWLAISDRESSDQRYKLQLVSVETGEKRALMPQESGGRNAFIPPAISADGRYLAFSRIPEGLFVLDLNDDLSAAAEPRRIKNNTGGFTTDMAWTADSTELIVSVGAGILRRSLYRVRADGSTPAKQLGFSAQVAGDGVALSPPAATHGGRLVFSLGSRDSNIYRLVLSGEGHEVHRFASSTLNDNSPQFSRDGTRVAFASNRADNQGTEIWVCKADGSNAMQVTFCDDFCGSPRWSPDGKWIAFDRRMKGPPDIYVVAAEGGPLRRVTTHPGTDFLPSWSVDGNWIYFGSNRTGEFQIWKTPAAGGNAEQLTHGGGQAAFESPDGTSVFYTKSPGPTNSLWKIAVSGGRETEVLPIVFRRNFAVTNSGIWHVVELDPYAPEIRFFDFSSGESRVVHNMNGPAFDSLAVSPDEKSILFVQADQSNSDLMIVEDFR